MRTSLTDTQAREISSEWLGVARQMLINARNSETNNEAGMWMDKAVYAVNQSIIVLLQKRLNENVDKGAVGELKVQE